MQTVVSTTVGHQNGYMAGLGPLVRERRLRLGWTQSELADRVSSSPQHISQIETGARKWPRELVPDLAEALGLSQVDMAIAAGLIEPPPVTTDRAHPVPLDPVTAAVVELMAGLGDMERTHLLGVAEFLAERGSRTGRDSRSRTEEQGRRVG